MQVKIEIFKTGFGGKEESVSHYTGNGESVYKWAMGLRHDAFEGHYGRGEDIHYRCSVVSDSGQSAELFSAKIPYNYAYDHYSSYFRAYQSSRDFVSALKNSVESSKSTLEGLMNQLPAGMQNNTIISQDQTLLSETLKQLLLVNQQLSEQNKFLQDNQGQPKQNVIEEHNHYTTITPASEKTDNKGDKSGKNSDIIDITDYQEIPREKPPETTNTPAVEGKPVPRLFGDRKAPAKMLGGEEQKKLPPAPPSFP